MGKYVRLGLGIVAGAVAGIAVYAVIRSRCRCAVEKPPFAESPEYSKE